MAISVTLDEKSLAVDDCHFVTEPVLPLKVNSVLFVPEQTVALPEIEPPTDVGAVTVKVLGV